jgi:hypothetical protein
MMTTTATEALVASPPQQRSASQGSAATTSATGTSALTTTNTITTLGEAAEMFAAVGQRAQRACLQIAAFKAHEQQIRKFLLERALPHADEVCRERDYVAQRHDEEYGHAVLRLKGVHVPASGGGGGGGRGGRYASNSRAEDDPQMAAAVAALRAYSQKHNTKAVM